MFKKSDWLSLILAFFSTVIVVGLGYWLIAKINVTRLATGNIADEEDSTSQSLDATELDSQSTSESTESASPDTVFVMPTIVPEGTSVIINGSVEMNSLNEALKRSFHRQFPGTAITTDADGSEIAMELLAAGNIDLVAIERPLNQAEREADLAAVKINNNLTLDNATGTDRELYYVYRQPINPDVEIFLGYVLSPLGQQITLDALTVNSQQ